MASKRASGDGAIKRPVEPRNTKPIEPRTKKKLTIAFIQPEIAIFMTKKSSIDHA